MKWLPAGLVIALSMAHGMAEPQPKPTTKKKQVFTTPLRMKSEQQRRNVGREEWGRIQWDLAWQTMPSETALKKDVVESQLGPFRSARSVSGDATMAERSRKFGAGEPSHRETMPPTRADYLNGVSLPEQSYPGQAEQEAILEAVYRHFFSYRDRGFGTDLTAYFLGLGPHDEDAPAGVIERLAKTPELTKQKITVLPASRAMEITDAEIRDRDSGAYGAVFRVDDVGIPENDEVKVLATFSERDGFWFSQEMTLRKEKGSWKVVSERDYPLE